jgi:RNA polymerase sigma-70 factor, ECF subfamily
VLAVYAAPAVPATHPAVRTRSRPVTSDIDLDPDRDLAERFRAGDRSAFDMLVRRHQKGIWRIVRRYVKRDADAADVTQQVFVRAFKGLASFRGAATVRSWLYRIAINCALSWVRDHRRELDELDPGGQLGQLDQDALARDRHSVAIHGRSVDAVAHARIESGQDGKRLRAAIAQLPPKQRTVLELRVFDDLSFREVAELAECTENTAKVTFHYAVKRLREILGGADGA